jgi:hypothetical protein
MSDTPAESASRLPELPNAGYASQRAKFTSDVICNFLRTVERNRPFLLTIVTDGLEKWLRTATRAWRYGMVIDGDILRSVWSYMVRMAGPNPEAQLHALHGMMRIDEITQFDTRATTRSALTEGLRAAMKDLRQQQKKSRH